MILHSLKRSSVVRSLALSLLVLASVQGAGATPVITEIGFDLNGLDSATGVSNEFIEIQNIGGGTYDASHLGIIVLNGNKDNSGGPTFSTNPGQVIDSIDLSFALTQGSNPTTLADQDFVLTVEGGPYTIVPPNTGSLVDLCVVGSSSTSPPPIPCPNGLFVPLNLEIGSQTFWLVDTSTTPLPALNFDYDTNNDGVIESPTLVPTVLDQVLIDDGGGSTAGCGTGGSDRVYPAPNIFPTPTPLCQVQVLDPTNPSSSYANGAIVFRDANGVLQTAELAGGVNPDGSCSSTTTVPPGTPANLLTICNSTNPV